MQVIFKKDAMIDIRNEASLMKPILQILQENGGEADRTTIDALIPEYTNFSSDDLMQTKVSKKTNKEYRPYLFARNFALKNLALAGILTYSRNEPVKLTRKGLDINIDSFSSDDVYKLSMSYWKKKQKERERQDAIKSELFDDDKDEPEIIINDDDNWREDILDGIKQLSPKKFEDFCRGLLNRMGFEMDSFKGVQTSHDFGIDGFGYSVDSQSLRTTRVAIQCKRYDGHPVGSADINSLRGSIDTNRADYGIFITTSYFSNEAKKSSRIGSTPITLIDGDRLVNLMIEYEYKLKPVTTYVIDEIYFDK